MTDDNTDAETAPSPPVDALAEHATQLGTTDPLAPVPDPDGLEAILGDARIVGLGEATHELQAHTREEPRPGSVDAVLDELGDSPVLLDLRTARADDHTGDWVTTPQGTFSAGARYDPDSPRQYITEYVPGAAFDALCHVAETARARPLGDESA